MARASGHSPGLISAPLSAHQPFGSERDAPQMSWLAGLARTTVPSGLVTHTPTGAVSSTARKRGVFALQQGVLGLLLLGDVPVIGDDRLYLWVFQQVRGSRSHSQTPGAVPMCRQR